MQKTFPVVVRMTVLFLLLTGPTVAQQPAASTSPVRVLIVVAHPDDESCFAATVYEITHNLGGTVDQLVVTNGEGGYRYSLLAESYYGIALTDEATGHAALPEIRKRELLEAGKVLGISNHFFLDEPDLRYTQDIDEVLTQHWHQGVVLPAVQRRLAGGNYDFVFTLFPSPQTHGGHKAATLTAINAVQQLTGRKPVVLGCQGARIDAETQPSWAPYQSPQHPFSVLPQVFSTDRTVKFGFNNALDYRIVVSWAVAAHKSQGAFQANVNRIDHENFVVLESGATDETARATSLFRALSDHATHPPGVAPKPSGVASEAGK
ncbi:MAG TPA: PIG-L family deacetylase [Candidatus Saccharimonadales bacterium]|nr:PIG-L family deacetylase [Candidatus Saccharimonadales bacterium]